ncbi:hypothetical protein EGI05_09015 [Chryseobacterium daecheongense]|uniref:HTH luxR-type domain-containing protein n=2 Tax=Chryseobacterium daecheongense TaxID=192389 RepID=A0A3N0VYB3_9FLAO|nr:hypothetical protein EGI05_09015 [Chryseobacterium daecheongense]
MILYFNVKLYCFIYLAFITHLNLQVYSVSNISYLPKSVLQKVGEKHSVQYDMDTIKMAKISGIFWKKENVEDEISKLYCIIGCIVFVGIILFILIHNQYTSKQKQKDLVIIEKELELEYLKKKLNTAFEEVLQLAKDDDVSFLTRFNEVYPEFSKKLSLKYPDLTSNDIKFCALLKLNFSNKEIAQYGHLSIRTVESKKYRLRKKLKLTSDVDLNKWMMRQ